MLTNRLARYVGGITLELLSPAGGFLANGQALGTGEVGGWLANGQELSTSVSIIMSHHSSPEREIAAHMGYS